MHNDTYSAPAVKANPKIYFRDIVLNRFLFVYPTQK